MRNAEATRGSEYSLSVSRALTILSSFTHEQPELGLSEISRAHSLSKASASRFLLALEMHGYIERNPTTRKYRIGTEAARVGGLFMAGGRLKQIALPIMEELVGRLGFSSYLSALRDDRIIILACVESAGPIKYSIPVGTKLPVHSTATGQAALACTDATEFAAILARAGLAARTRSTITTRSALAARIAEVRARGYSINWEENTAGIASIAAAVCNGDSRPLCVLSLGFATSQVKREQMPELGREVKAAAAALAASLAAKGLLDVE